MRRDHRKAWPGRTRDGAVTGDLDWKNPGRRGPVTGDPARDRARAVQSVTGSSRCTRPRGAGSVYLAPGAGLARCSPLTSHPGWRGPGTVQPISGALGAEQLDGVGVRPGSGSPGGPGVSRGSGCCVCFPARSSQRVPHWHCAVHTQHLWTFSGLFVTPSNPPRNVQRPALVSGGHRSLSPWVWSPLQLQIRQGSSRCNHH